MKKIILIVVSTLFVVNSTVALAGAPSTHKRFNKTLKPISKESKKSADKKEIKRSETERKN